MRRAVLALVAAGAAAAWLRSRAAGRERVELHFEDGSMVSLGAGDERAAELVATARGALAATRT